MSTPAPHGYQFRPQLPTLANIRARLGRVELRILKPSRSVITVSPDLRAIIDLMKFAVAAYVAIRYSVGL